MRTVVNRRPRWRALALMLGLGLVGCGGGAGNGSTASEAGVLRTVASIYPLAFVAEQVGGDAVSVTTLTPPGVEPHDLEISASQVIAIQRADLVLTVPGFAAVDEAVAQNNPKNRIDLLNGVDLLPLPGEKSATSTSFDPHVWLNPANMATMADAVAVAIAAKDPQQATAVRARAAAFGKEMTQLGKQFQAGVKQCRSRDLVVTHAAFGYLARRFDFTQYPLSGISPEAEPSPARLRELAGLIESKGVTTVYFEALVSPKVAQTLASETGVKTAVLDPIEGNTDNRGYPELMRANLQALQAGQGCS